MTRLEMLSLWDAELQLAVNDMAYIDRQFVAWQNQSNEADVVAKIRNDEL